MNGVATYLSRCRESNRQVTYWKQREVIRFLWFAIAAATVIQLALLDVGEKPFY